MTPSFVSASERTMAANLDALCDMLDAEISDEEEAEEKEDAEDEGNMVARWL